MHWAPGTTQEFQVSEGYVVSKSLWDIRSGMEGHSAQWFCDSGNAVCKKEEADFRKEICSVSLLWNRCKVGLSALQKSLASVISSKGNAVLPLQEEQHGCCEEEEAE